MGFTSLFFYIFAAVTVAVYYLVRKHQWVVLLVFSVAFYLTWGWEKLPFILMSAAIAWLAGRVIAREYGKVSDGDEEQKKKAKKAAGVIAGIAVVLLLGMLMYVKVWGRIAWRLFADGGSSILVPLGISYYTFSLIGYVLDCYWRKEQYEGNYLKLLLFASYFPKVLQGPIVKYRSFASQLIEVHRYDRKNLCYGLQRMLWGYFKKLVIADRLALFVNTVYGDYGNKSGSMLLVATVFGAFQLYCDFSGCMDIACGFSEILGIKLDENFRRPFFAESAAEFWRRWHITLGAWFRDYVYMPISISPRMMKLMQKVRNRWGMHAAKNVGTIIALSVVWLLTGLWHEVGRTYVIWGMYWGILIILGVLLEPFYRKLAETCHIRTDSPEWHLFRRLRTFLLFLISRVVTIPGSIRTALQIFRRMVTEFRPWELVDGTIYRMGIDRAGFAAVIVFLILLWHVSRYQEAEGGRLVRDWIAERQIVARWIIWYALFFAILIFGAYGPGYDASGFVYMRF